MNALLNAKEVCALLGIKHSTWANRKKLGWHKQFQTTRPIGQRQYARVLVERFINGEMTNQFGRRSA